MTYNRQKHHRRSIRLKGYDYSQPGAYFITIVTQDRAHLFGAVVDGEMRLNEWGEIVCEEWFQSAQIRQEIQLNPDEFVIMPNHIHGIVWFVYDGTSVGAHGTSVGAHGTSVGAHGTSVGAHGTSVGAHGTSVGAHGRAPLPGQRMPRSLASFIAGFKSIVTKRINQQRGTPGAPLWQRNYYEHIIRNNDELNRIRKYIVNNPSQWALDQENPEIIIPIGQTRVGAPTKDEPWRT